MEGENAYVKDGGNRVEWMGLGCGQINKQLQGFGKWKWVNIRISVAKREVYKEGTTHLLVANGLACESTHRFTRLLHLPRHIFLLQRYFEA